MAIDMKKVRRQNANWEKKQQNEIHFLQLELEKARETAAFSFNMLMEGNDQYFFYLVNHERRVQELMDEIQHMYNVYGNWLIGAID